MKFIATFCLCIFFLSIAVAQNDSAASRHVLYAEGGGFGGFGSLNYENVFYRHKLFNLSARAGISTYQVIDFSNRFNPDVIIPVAVYAFFGKTHFAEIGLGQTISSTVGINIENLEPHRYTTVSAGFSAGYRYQRNKGGVFFRVSYSPIIEFYETFRHWGGLSFGYVFKPKTK